MDIRKSKYMSLPQDLCKEFKVSQIEPTNRFGAFIPEIDCLYCLHTWKSNQKNWQPMNHNCL